MKYADYQIETAFYSPIDYKTNDQQLGDWKAELSDNRLIGGFVFYRGLDWWQTASNSEKAATLLRFPDTASRERPVYIEKYGDITAVCLNTPCIPQSEKDRIDDEIKTVVIATHQTLNSTIELCRQGIIAKEFIIPVEFSGYTNYAVKYYPISETFEFWKDYQPIEGVDDISMKPCPDVEKQSYVHGENIHLQSEGPNHCCLSTP